MHPRLTRFLSLGALLLWMAPGTAALTAALHVALEHPPQNEASRPAEMERLVRAAAHGHHHDIEAPEHIHRASLTSRHQVCLPDCVDVGTRLTSSGTVNLKGRPLPESGTLRAPPAASPAHLRPLLL